MFVAGAHNSARHRQLGQSMLAALHGTAAEILMTVYCGATGSVVCNQGSTLAVWSRSPGLLHNTDFVVYVLKCLCAGVSGYQCGSASCVMLRQAQACCNSICHELPCWRRPSTDVAPAESASQLENAQLNRLLADNLAYAARPLAAHYSLVEPGTPSSGHEGQRSRSQLRGR